MPVFERDGLTLAARVDGPAIVEAYDSTTYIAPDWSGAVDGRSARAAARNEDAMTDPITTEVIKNALVYATEEMGIAVRNAAYSPNIKERLDHSCALFDRFGRLIAQAEHIPVHLGSLPWGLQRMLEIVEREYGGAREGEMWVANDPYITGTHLNDVTLVRPIFDDGRLVGYAANKAHHADVGGSVPGSMPADAADLFAEGLIVPPLRIVREDRVARRSRRALSRELAHARGAQRRPARASRRQLHRRAAPARALRSLRRRNARGGDRASARRQRASHARGACGSSATASSKRPIISKIATASPASRIALRLELRDGCARLDYTGTSRQVGFPLNAVLRRHALGRALRAARGHRSDDSDERRMLSPRRGGRAGRVAAQPAPAGAGLGRKRRDEHAQRRRRLASAGASRAGTRPGLQRRDDEQRHARRNAPRRPNAGRSTKRTAAGWARARPATASTRFTAT